MLTNSIATFASAAIFAALSIATAANAGGCHGGGPRNFHAYQSTPSPAYAAQLRAKEAAQARAIAAAKRKKQTETEARAAQKARAQAFAAKAAAKLEKEELTSAEPVAKAAEPAKVASVEETCSKFIAATGTTVEVDCAKE